MKTHCNTKKKELKCVKIKLQWGEGKVSCVCAHIPAREMRKERQAFRETDWVSEKIIQEASAHMFIFVIKLISVIKSSF